MVTHSLGTVMSTENSHLGMHFVAVRDGIERQIAAVDRYYESIIRLRSLLIVAPVAPAQEPVLDSFGAYE
jgi:hypothetical protein